MKVPLAQAFRVKVPFVRTFGVNVPFVADRRRTNPGARPL
jgi:hypothetical protein